MEFSALAQDDLDFDSPELLEFYFFSRTGLDPDLPKYLPGDPYRTRLSTSSQAYRPDGKYLDGKRVLDAGCGGGRFTPIAASRASHVVALDAGDHIARTAQRCAHLENVDVVQGSVLAPPFKPATFDYVFSLGVLHHTDDPAGGCERLGALVNAKGGMSVWVYSPSYWGGKIRAPFGYALHWLISHMSHAQALSFCVRVLYPLGRWQAQLAKRPWTKRLGAPFFAVNIPRHQRPEVMKNAIYDYYGPPIISTHTVADISSWLTRAGLSEIRVGWVPSSVFAQRPQASSTRKA